MHHKVKKAKRRVAKAIELRHKARAALRKKGKPIPAALAKGGMANTKRKLHKMKHHLVVHGHHHVVVHHHHSMHHKVKKAKRRVAKAIELRHKARAALRKKGKPIPAALAKGGMANTKRKLHKMNAKAKMHHKKKWH